MAVFLFCRNTLEGFFFLYGRRYWNKCCWGDRRGIYGSIKRRKPDVSTV